ncbi:hypothetical protein Taro_012789 [Colocasia esculenta]|uniref:Uncharacterized protein n=1 Tax=Colocasia esculenta TaxID=4460 RepID=A0A843UEI4_COLES|nr:hypothetical protein [Colocasia esculenta]
MVLLCCHTCSPGARHLRACPRSELLLSSPGTPILERLRWRYRGDKRAQVDSLVWRTLELRGKRCSVCHVASLVERCDTCLWLLSAWCWLVVNSGEVLSEFFSVGSGGSEIFSRTVPWRFWWRFSQDQLVLLLLAAVFSLEVCRLVGLRSGEILLGWLLALLGGGSPQSCFALFAEGCFHIMPDSIGFCGSQFLLLWPVRDW